MATAIAVACAPRLPRRPPLRVLHAAVTLLLLHLGAAMLITPPRNAPLQHAPCPADGSPRIPVYILSLPDAALRRARISSHLQRLGFDGAFAFVDGARVYSVADVAAHAARLRVNISTGDIPADATQGNAGCAVGWLNALQAAEDAGAPVTLLLEDDVVPTDDAALAAFVCDPSAYLTALTSVDLLFVHPHVAAHKWGAQAMLVTLAGLRTLLADAPGMLRDMGWLLMDLRIINGRVPGLAWTSGDRLGLPALFYQPEGFECGFGFAGGGGVNHSMRCVYSEELGR